MIAFYGSVSHNPAALKQEREISEIHSKVTFLVPLSLLQLYNASEKMLVLCFSAPARQSSKVCPYILLILMCHVFSPWQDR